MSGQSPAPGREEVIALLAEHHACAPEAVGERIDSLELAWLVHVLEERHGIRIDLDEELEAMDTVDGAVTVLAGVLPAPGAAHPAGAADLAEPAGTADLAGTADAADVVGAAGGPAGGRAS